MTDRLRKIDDINVSRWSITSARFSPDNTMIAVASYDGVVKIYKIQNERLVYLKEIKHKDTVWAANFSPDSKMIITASDDGTTRITLL